MKKVEGVEERVIEDDDEVQESDAPGGVYQCSWPLEALKNQGLYS